MAKVELLPDLAAVADEIRHLNMERTRSHSSQYRYGDGQANYNHILRGNWFSRLHNFTKSHRSGNSSLSLMAHGSRSQVNHPFLQVSP